jgi:hypothetical protein
MKLTPDQEAALFRLRDCLAMLRDMALPEGPVANPTTPLDKAGLAALFDILFAEADKVLQS